MPARFSGKLNPTPALCLLVALLMAAGCQVDPNNPDGGMMAVRGLQLNNMVQSNAERAGFSADFAKEQTCPAATVYRTRSRVFATQAQAVAEQSDQLAQELSTLLENRGKVLGFSQMASNRFDESRPRLEEANAAFIAVYEQGDQARLRDVLPAMKALQDAVDTYGRDMLHVADAFLPFVRNPDNAGLLDGYFDDPDAVAVDFQAKAEDMMGNIQIAGNQEYKVPENPREPSDYTDPDDWVPYNEQMRIADMRGSLSAEDFNRFLAVRDLVYMQGEIVTGLVNETRDPALNALATIQQQLQYASGQMLDQMNEKSDQIQSMIDESQALAAEATRQAWLAHEACGGELPPDFPDVENPFDTTPTGIPDWSATFWDISSP